MCKEGVSSGPPVHVYPDQHSTALTCLAWIPWCSIWGAREHTWEDINLICGAQLGAPLPVADLPARMRVSEGAFFSAARARAPLSPTHLPSKPRARVCSKGASFGVANAWTRCCPLKRP